jgi:hypothetical protein
MWYEPDQDDALVETDVRGGMCVRFWATELVAKPPEMWLSKKKRELDHNQARWNQSSIR